MRLLETIKRDLDKQQGKFDVEFSKLRRLEKEYEEAKRYHNL